MDTQETKIYIAALIAAAVLAIILLYFIITMIRQQRRTQKLNREKIEAEILTLEKERQRIATDLHDDLGPLLSSIKFQIEAVEPASEEEKDLIQKASFHVDETIRHIREITYDLMPNTLVRKGLVSGVQELFGKLEGSLPLKITFTPASIPEISHQKAINVYRIIQEILHNTLKHSKASELCVELFAHNSMLILRTEDNGVGFDYEKKVDEHRGLGLRNLLSRVEIMNGNLVVNTNPGKGVKYKFEIPID